VSTSDRPTTEFQLIQNLKSRYSLDKVGDDCAVLPKGVTTDLLITSDMLIEDVDFRLSWSSPESIGHKALAVSLSDIAAMGGTALWGMVSVGIPERLWHEDFLEKFYQGWFSLAGEFNVELVGGDVSRSVDGFVVDSIVGGEVPRDRAILRSTAKPGDEIFVSGELGGAAAGLRMLEAGERSERSAGAVARLLTPRPQLNLANYLQSLHLVSSMIDISDGLSSELTHICNMSGVGANIFANAVPIQQEVTLLYGRDEALDLAINGGEDFELLFTAPRDSIESINNFPVTKIGEITDRSGLIVLVSPNECTPLKPKGFRHF
jgi:thiamine-monophosphate kinase